MKVSKELIEKYHRGECSEEEKYWVEEWLFDDQSTEELILPVLDDKEEHKQTIWAGIAPALASVSEKGQRQNRVLSGGTLLRGAASVIMMLLSGWWLWSHQLNADTQRILEASNISDIDNRNINSRLYTLSLGPNSNVRIDSRQELMELCGTLAFTPNEDVTMRIIGECPKGISPQTVVELKGGLNYIAFSYQNTEAYTELIVVEQNQLNILPSFIQKQLISQFKI